MITNQSCTQVIAQWAKRKIDKGESVTSDAVWQRILKVRQRNWPSRLPVHIDLEVIESEVTRLITRYETKRKLLP